MSVAQAQEMYDILLKVDKLLNGITVKADAETAKRQERTEAYITIQQTLRVLWRIQAMLRRMGIPEDVTTIIQTFNKITRSIMMMNYAANLFWSGIEAKMAGQPWVYGVVAGAIGIAGSELALVSYMDGY